MASSGQINLKITYGSIISISHIEDEDALIASDGFVKQSVMLRGMSPNAKQNTNKFSTDQLNHLFMSNCLFLVCPKIGNLAKMTAIGLIKGDDYDQDDEESQVPIGQQNNTEEESPELKKETLIRGKEVTHKEIKQIQINLLNEYKFNVESYEKEKQLMVTYDQPVQFLHLASSKFLACHRKEAKFENQNFKFSLDMYPSDATLFRIISAFKFQKEGDQIIYASEVVNIVRQIPILDKLTYLHCSGEKFKGQNLINKDLKKDINKDQIKIQKREVNASLEEATSWKLNLYSEYIPEISKLLKCGDIIWLHHTECNATLAATRKQKPFDSLRFNTLDLASWLAPENLHISVEPSFIAESSFEKYVGNTYSMWVIESSYYKNGGVVQFEKQYRLKHFSSGLYLSVARLYEVPPPPPKKARNPYEVKKQAPPQLPSEFISQKDPPAKFNLSAVPDRTTLFEFIALKQTDDKHLSQGAIIFLRNVEHKKYIDIVHRVGEDVYQLPGDQQASDAMIPVMRNEKEKNEHAVFKIYQAHSTESWELMFLDSATKCLWKYLHFISIFQWKGDHTDIDLMKQFERKLFNSILTVNMIENFVNNKNINSVPEQKYGLINGFRQSLLRQQYIIDILVKMLQESMNRTELEMWDKRKELKKEIELEGKQEKQDKEKEVARPKKQTKGVGRKEILELIIKKVELCNVIYRLMASICRGNTENQIYAFELLPYFQLQTKFIPLSVTFLIEITSNSMNLMLRLSQNLRVDFDYRNKRAFNDNPSSKVKILINLYESDPAANQVIMVAQQNGVAFKKHEKISQKPLNLINYFFNLLWDESSPTKEDYLSFLRSVCRYKQQAVMINQENIYKLYKKFNDSKQIMGVVYDEMNDPWDGRIRIRGSELILPELGYRKEIKLLQEQFSFFSEVSYGRNFIWKAELMDQFPQSLLFQSIWKDHKNARVQDMRYLLCHLSMSLYIDQRPFSKIIYPSFCRLFMECDKPRVNEAVMNFITLQQSNNILSPLEEFQEDEVLLNKPEINEGDQDFKLLYKQLFSDLLEFFEKTKLVVLEQIRESNPGIGKNLLNDELMLKSCEMLYLLLELDAFEIVEDQQDVINTYYMRIIEPLLFLMQYDRKNQRYLKASQFTIDAEVKRRKEKKIQKNNINPIKIGNPMNLIMKETVIEQAPVVVDIDTDENFNAGQQLDSAQVFANPIMRGFISINNQLEALTYQEYSQIRLEIEFKLKVCAILDNFLDRRQNFLISNILVFFRRVVLKDVQAEEQVEDCIIEEQDQSILLEDPISVSQMRKFVDDYLISIIPGIAMTGIKEIDFPDKPNDDVFGTKFASFGIGKLGGAPAVALKPTIFTDYFKKLGIAGINCSFALDQYVSLFYEDEDISYDCIASVLPYFLGTFFFVHDEKLEERCLNVTMRVFNQREELKLNLEKLQILFDSEKSLLFQVIERQLSRLTCLIENSEVWLSEFCRKGPESSPEDLRPLSECHEIIANLSRGFFYDLKFNGDQMQAHNQVLIDPYKQSVMGFLRVQEPILEIIKSGFHKMVDVLLDPMFDEKRKVLFVELYSGVYQFLQRFARGNSANQATLYSCIDTFMQFLRFDVGQILLIQELFRDNTELLTTKVDLPLIKSILMLIDHEGRQASFIDLITVMLKNKSKYIFDNQLLVLNTFLPMREYNEFEIKMLYSQGSEGGAVNFYLDDNVYQKEDNLIQRLRDVDWKDTYRDEPFLYHSALLNMLIQTTIVLPASRLYDPLQPDINFCDNFNISIVKLKKAFPAILLLNLLHYPDDLIEANVKSRLYRRGSSQQSQIGSIIIQGSGDNNLIAQKMKASGFSLLKIQVLEFIRLVHITSEKKNPSSFQMTQFHYEFQLLIELETRRLEKIQRGTPYKPEYVNYLIEGVIPLLLSYHERILTQNNGENMDGVVVVAEGFSQRLAICLEVNLYKEIKNRRQAQIILKLANFYSNPQFKEMLPPDLQSAKNQKPSTVRLMKMIKGQGLNEDDIDQDSVVENSRIFNSNQENNYDIESIKDDIQPLVNNSKRDDVNNSKSMRRDDVNNSKSMRRDDVNNSKSKKNDDSKVDRVRASPFLDLSKMSEIDPDKLQLLEDSWSDFLTQLLESKKLQEEIDREKQVFADAIINVEKMISNEYADVKPSIDIVIKKFINFLQYAVKQPNNKGTVITLLKIMHKIIKKEEDLVKRVELQNQFDKLGATKMVLVVISQQTNNIDQNLLFHILQFANCLLEGGNQRVQRTVYDFFITYQRSEIIFQTFAETIKKQIIHIETETKAKEKMQTSALLASESSSAGLKGPVDGSDSPQIQDEDSSNSTAETLLNQVLQFLQNCVEGHYMLLQDYLRIQTNSRTSYDIINLITDLFKTYYFKECTTNIYDNMIKCLDTLNELVQGPCPENQIAVAESKFFDIVMDLFPFRKPVKAKIIKRTRTNLRKLPRRKIKQQGDALEPWMVARLQNKVLVLVLSLLEMREIKGKNSIIKRIMRNLPLSVLERHLAKIFKNVNIIYGNQYLMQSLCHLEVDPRDLEPKELASYHKLYFQTIIQNGFLVFFLICYYFESDEPLNSPLVSMHKTFVKNMVKRESGGLFDPNSTIGQLIQLFQEVYEKSLFMAKMVKMAADKLKGGNDDEIIQLKLRQKQEERRRRLNQAFNFFMSNVAHIEVVRNKKLEIVFFPLLPYAKSFPKDEKQKFQDIVDRSSVKAKVQGLVKMSKSYNQIMVHEENMKGLYHKYKLIGFFANYIQLWKDIAFYLTILLNLIIISSFSLDPGMPSADRMESYVFFRKSDWSKDQTKILVNGIGVGMTLCAMFVVVFFLIKIAPLIVTRALANKSIFDEPHPGILKRLINNLYKLFFVLFSCLADFEVLYYLGYGCMAVFGLIIHPFFFSFHLSVILIRYPTLKNVIRAVSEPKEQLLLTLVLLLVLTYIYAIIAFLSLQDDFKGDCNTILYCFLFIFDQNLKNPGGVGGLLTGNNPSPSYTPERFISDQINNLLIVVIMINIVAGIIIDTFGSLREEENSKQSDIKDKCFMCGLENVVFERKSDGNSGGFQGHIRVNHYMWNYLFYITYIRWKNPQDYSGIESYVKGKLDADDLMWIPFNQAMELSDLTEDETAIQQKQITDIKNNMHNMIENSQAIIKVLKMKEKGK